MFFLIWRGYGLLAVVPPILALVVGGALGGVNPAVGGVAAGVTLAAAGVGLAVLGRRLNQFGNHHSLYWIPLWVWGVVCALLGLAVAGLMGLAAVAPGPEGG